MRANSAPPSVGAPAKPEQEESPRAGDVPLPRGETEARREMLRPERDGAPGLVAGWSEIRNGGCVFMQKTGAHQIGEYGLKQGAQQGGELWGSDRYPRAEGQDDKYPQLS